MENLKDKILEEYKNGNVVFAHAFGTEVAKLDEFINQPIDGILFDLNRSESVVLHFINDPKWINDYAVCKVIRTLKAKIDKLEKDNEQYRESDKRESLYDRD